MSKKETIKQASVLAFERKLANSDALMYSGRWSELDNDNAWNPIRILEKSVRGTISNRLKDTIANDPAKLDSEVQKANLQIVEVATLPADSDTLKVFFTLRVIGDLSTPTVCNEPTYQSKIKDIVDTYRGTVGFGELASRYAENIANGRFLWRNRLGAEKILVHVVQLAHQQNNSKTEEKIINKWVFDSYMYDLRKFTNHSDIKELASSIAEGLSGTAHTFFKIYGYVLMGEGQEVFPSQELVLGDSKNKSEKSKILYNLNDVAAIHSQKIGNALRTIDTWYNGYDGAECGPIAAEPYGAVTSRGIAYRQPKTKTDFYSLLDDWVMAEKMLDKEQQHYVMSILIRGGVFGKKEEKSGNKNEE